MGLQHLSKLNHFRLVGTLTMKIIGMALLATSTAAIVTGLNVVSAQAATMFNFANGNAIGNFPGVPSLSFSQGGIGLTATGSAQGTPALVVQNNQGLGVYSGIIPVPTNPLLVDSAQIDANGSDETLKLTFDQTIRIVSATFSRVGFGGNSSALGNDFYTLSSNIGGSLVTNKLIPGGNILDLGTGSENFTAFLSSAQRTGSVFNFSVPSGGGILSSDYQLLNLTVEAVPTPALLPGLLGLGVSLARKRKQQALAAE
jgi:hypothetical protein